MFWTPDGLGLDGDTGGRFRAAVGFWGEVWGTKQAVVRMGQPQGSQAPTSLLSIGSSTEGPAGVETRPPRGDSCFQGRLFPGFVLQLVTLTGWEAEL